MSDVNVTVPEDVEKFLNENPRVAMWDVMAEKINSINVTVIDKRDLITFPTNMGEWRFYANCLDVPPDLESIPDNTQLIETELLEDEIDMSHGDAEMAATPHKVPKTDDELRQLAMDIVENRVFTDRHLKSNEAHMIGSVFLPLSLMSPEQAKEIFEDVGMIYEYYIEAMPRAINGLPCFGSVRFLSSEETDRLAPMIQTIQSFKRAFLGKKETNEPAIAATTGSTNTEEQSNTDVLPLQTVHN